MRINIPSNVDALIKLAKDISKKHTALGTASPLNNIEGIADFDAQVTAADTNNELAKQLAKQETKATEDRDNALGSDFATPGTVRYFVTAIRNVLAGQNKGSEHKLGDWGYEVIASPAVTPEAKAAAQSARAAAKAAKSKPAS
jgi:hypothetical protein